MTTVEMTTAPAAAAPQLVDIENVIPASDNPRFLIDEAAAAELRAGISSLGLLQNLVCRPHPDPKLRAAGKLELRAGHRRLAAAKKLGLKEVPVIVREMDEQTAAEVTAAENFQRKQLHPLEEANAVALLLRTGHDITQTAAHLGRSVEWVSRRSSITRLTERWRKLAMDPNSAVHAWGAPLLERIARLPEATQDLLLEKRKYIDPMSESVPTLEILDVEIERTMHVLTSAPWKLDDPELLPAAGACSRCPKRSSVAPLLFDDLHRGKKKEAADRCLDPRCWEKKSQALIQMTIHHTKQETGKAPVLVKTCSCWTDDEKATVKKLTGVKQCLHEWHLERCDEKAKGAFPAIVLHGYHASDFQHTPTFRWMRERLKRSSPAAKPKSDAAGVALRKVQRAILAHHIEALNQWKVLINSKNGLGGKIRPPTLRRLSILKAVAAFGVPGIEGDYNVRGGGWRYVEHMHPGDDQQYFAELLTGLLDSFVWRLRPNPYDRDWIKWHMEECRHQCEFLGVEWLVVVRTIADKEKAPDKVRALLGLVDPDKPDSAKGATAKSTKTKKPAKKKK